MRDLRSGDARAYNCVGSSSFSCSLTGLNDEGFLVCCITRLAVGLFPDVGGLAKSGRLQRRLLGVVDEPDVPGVESSSS